MRVVISGASGFLGTQLRAGLAHAGHEVVRLVRGTAATPDESSWDPAAGTVDAELIESADVVVCLSGAPITQWPLTQAKKDVITSSRVDSTRALALAVATSKRRPALLAQNGISVYGDRGDAVLAEDAPDGTGFLSQVSRAWQDSTRPALSAGVRVCVLRTGVVLDRRAGALALMQWPFRFGLAGRLGSGSHYMPIISLRDWVAATIFLAEHDSADGIYNLSCPAPPTNAEFTRTLGRALHRPAVIPVPGVLLRTVLGPDLAPMLLDSLRTHPAALLAAGFGFSDPDVEAVVQTALHPA